MRIYRLVKGTLINHAAGAHFQIQTHVKLKWLATLDKFKTVH